MSWKNLKQSLPELDREDLLEAIGLESRRTSSDKLVPVLAIFGAGVLVGVGLGLMLAPKPGRELRDDLRTRLKKGELSPNGQAGAASDVAVQPS